MSTEFKCPKCGNVLSLTANDVAIGSKFECGGCGFRLIAIDRRVASGEWDLVPDVAEIDSEHIT